MKDLDVTVNNKYLSKAIRKFLKNPNDPKVKHIKSFIQNEPERFEYLAEDVIDNLSWEEDLLLYQHMFPDEFGNPGEKFGELNE